MEVICLVFNFFVKIRRHVLNIAPAILHILLIADAQSEWSEVVELNISVGSADHSGTSIIHDFRGTTQKRGKICVSYNKKRKKTMITGAVPRDGRSVFLPKILLESYGAPCLIA